MSKRTGREITGRILIYGRLVLETPTHFGNGDIVGVTDMPLLRDPLDNKTPLLTGASIAGALRNYLREIERGYAQAGKPTDLSERLFGWLDEKNRASVQSWLLVDDALGEEIGIELRDGVSIDPVTRTAKDQEKYDMELLAAGTLFPICVEFLESKDSRGLLPGLAAALNGLALGEIGLGQRKRRGFGRCKVTEWRVRRYDLTQAKDLVAWLNDEGAREERGEDIFALLGIAQKPDDQREWFRMEATFGLPGSLLIRSSNGKPGSPDMVHLTSRRSGQEEAIVSGTSLAGAVRSRAGRIANTLLGADKGGEMIRTMFGYMDRTLEYDSSDTKRSAAGRPLTSGSRVVTEESIVTGVRALVQSRVKIDRFTGGAFPTALFSQQPIYGTPETQLTLTITLRNPKDGEIGLLLLVLKDLWTGDLPLGGENSVGRGRLAGRCATIELHGKNAKNTWKLYQEENGLRCEPEDGFPVLDEFVTHGLLDSQTEACTEGEDK